MKHDDLTHELENFEFGPLYKDGTIFLETITNCGYEYIPIEKAKKLIKFLQLKVDEYEKLNTCNCMKYRWNVGDDGNRYCSKCNKNMTNNGT